MIPPSTPEASAKKRGSESHFLLNVEAAAGQPYPDTVRGVDSGAKGISN